MDGSEGQMLGSEYDGLNKIAYFNIKYRYR